MEINGKSYSETVDFLRQVLDTEKNFDILEKHLQIAGKKASLFFIDGLTKDEILEKLLEYFYSLKKEDRVFNTYSIPKTS